MKRMTAFVLAMFLLFTSGVADNTSVYAAGKAPAKLTMNSRQASTYVGGTLKLKVASAAPKTASKSVTWKSSNKKLATVSQTGKVKAKKAGKVTVTAQSKINPKVKATCKVTIYRATEKLKLNSAKSYTLAPGKSVTLKAKVTKPGKGAQPVQWSSKNSKVAKVDSKGKVTAVSVGSTKVTGKSGNKKVTVKITVKKGTPDPVEDTETGGTESSGSTETGGNTESAGGTENGGNTENAGSTETGGSTESTGSTETGSTQTESTESESTETGNTQTPGSDAATPTPKEADTRAEWVAILSDKMGYQISESDLAVDEETGDIRYDYKDISGNPYAMKIEAAYYHRILPKSSKSWDGSLFDPDGAVTKEFAAVTVVRALGYALNEGLECADSAKLAYPEEDRCAVENELFPLKDNVFAPDEVLSAEERDRVVSFLDKVLADRKIDLNHKDIIVYAEGENIVDLSKDISGYTLEQVSGIGYEVSITQDGDASKIPLQEGDIIALPASKGYPAGMYLRVTDLEKNSDGEIKATGKVPDISEVYESLDLEGRVYLGSDEVILADSENKAKSSALSVEDSFKSKKRTDGFELTVSWEVGKNLPKFDFNKGKFEYTSPDIKELMESIGEIENSETKNSESGGNENSSESDSNESPIEKSFEISATLDIPYIEYDYEYQPKLHPISPLREVQLNIPNTITFEAKGSLEVESQIPLGKLIIPIGPTGITVDVSLYLDVRGNGSVTLKSELDGNIGFAYKKSPETKQNLSNYYGKQPVTLETAASLGAGIRIAAALTFCEVIVNVRISAEGGIVMWASTVVHYHGPAEARTCTDVVIYPYIELGIGLSLGPITAADADWFLNLPWFGKQHFDDGKCVAKCIFGCGQHFFP